MTVTTNPLKPLGFTDDGSAYVKDSADPKSWWAGNFRFLDL